MARLQRGITSHIATRLHEWGLAGSMVFLGLFFLLTDDALKVNRTYRILETLITERVWGGITLAIGCVWAAALALNGSFKPFRRVSPWFRGAMAIATASYCAMTAFTSIDSTISGPTWIYNVALCSMAVASILLIGHEIGRQG